MDSVEINSALGFVETAFQDTAFIEEIRQQMLRFASLQLGDKDMAEDAVQEALIGALRNAKSFGGRAALRTWVFAILKNKIADMLRQKQRLLNASKLLIEEQDDGDPSALFNAGGYWRKHERPANWGDPEASFNDGEFWRVFDACLNRLPPRQARVFMMREFIELETNEICAALGLTITNLHVILHRARLRLRECLENNWYHEGSPAC